MSALIFVAFGLASYLFFLATFLYMIAFIAGLPVPHAIDSGTVGPLGESIAVDIALLAIFGIQHSVMARGSFKQWWTRVVPRPIERSAYVLAASLALALIVWQWRPIPTPVVWDVGGLGALALESVFWLGWAIMLVASFLINHFELFGLKQVCNWLLKVKEGDGEFRTPFLYRYVRHPLYAGLILGFWATPRMSLGHLVFAGGFTVYILVGVYFEERDLMARFGPRYADYRRRVGMLLPGIK